MRNRFARWLSYTAVPFYFLAHLLVALAERVRAPAVPPRPPGDAPRDPPWHI